MALVKHMGDLVDGVIKDLLWFPPVRQPVHIQADRIVQDDPHVVTDDGVDSHRFDEPIAPLAS
jgi:hypothetical protein